MSMNNAVTIYTCGNLQEATVAKGLLEHAGIPVALEGKEASVTLWHVGTALGGVKLQVSAEHAERARELIQQMQKDRAEAKDLEPWICPTCGEEVEGNFDLCWSCGRSRAGGESEVETDSSVENESSETPDVESPSQVRQPEWDEAMESRAEDAKVNRIWRTTILGFLLFPLWFYAAWQMLTVKEYALSEEGKEKYQRSFWVLLIIFAILIGLLATTIWQQSQRPQPMPF